MKFSRKILRIKPQKFLTDNKEKIVKKKCGSVFVNFPRNMLLHSDSVKSCLIRRIYKYVNEKKTIK